MDVFRISTSRYIENLSGNGAQLYGGRWNSKGRPVIYTSGSRALAALEVLVHVPQKNLTEDFYVAVIFIPEQIKMKEIFVKNLPENWQEIPLQTSLQKLGDEYWKEGKYCVLKVPSVIIKEEWNYLINPLHPDARKIKIKAIEPFLFDKRLKESAIY